MIVDTVATILAMVHVMVHANLCVITDVMVRVVVRAKGTACKVVTKGA
jgi:hypothetical protein